MKWSLGIAVVVAFSSTSLSAAVATLQDIDMVMAGGSSGGSDQAWIRVNGQPTGVAADCSNGAKSLFFVDGSGGLSSEKALSIFLTARSSNRALVISYHVNSVASDFYDYGITKCQIDRVAVQ